MIEYTVKVYKDRTEWYLNGELHCEHGPAIEGANGHKVWYRGGKRHRDDGPAIEWADGSKAWYRNGKLHRDDGPAYEGANGAKEWYRDGKQLTEAEFNARMSNNGCNGKIVEIDGVQYKLELV